jgi:hypothetical protein
MTQAITPGSHKLGPVVVWYDAWAGPFLAVRVGARAGKEAIMGVFND